MDIVYQSSFNFQKLLSIQYRFVVSFRRTLQSISLNFRATDYFHICGYQYLDDIAALRDRKIILQSALTGVLTEQVLSKSARYQPTVKDEIDIPSRIAEVAYLEAYLDTNNVIKIFTLRNNPWLRSKIHAEYVIESSLPYRPYPVYIFLRKREVESVFCIVSLFQKHTYYYGGDRLYWMLKEKITSSSSTVLYKHPNYFP